MHPPLGRVLGGEVWVGSRTAQNKTLLYFASWKSYRARQNIVIFFSKRALLMSKVTRANKHMQRNNNQQQRTNLIKKRQSTVLRTCIEPRRFAITCLMRMCYDLSTAKFRVQKRCCGTFILQFGRTVVCAINHNPETASHKTVLPTFWFQRPIL